MLTSTSGFIAEAGFSHSLSPARNCTFGCTYCYVPTLGIYGGLKPDDVARWGQFTTFKENAAELLKNSVRPTQSIYCSPLVDPYQPAEETARLMPGLLQTLTERPPRVFVLQTRGPLILRDLAHLQALAQKTTLRVSFTVSTDREEVRRRYEPHCAPIADRWAVIRALTDAGIDTFVTLAPLLPCNAESLLAAAAAATPRDFIADPLHVRAVKTRGATTRRAAWQISAQHDEGEWLQPDFQAGLIHRMTEIAGRLGRRLGTGPAAFRWLTEVN